MIEIQNLMLRFGDRVLFDGLNLSAEAGEKVLLSGPSGTGKSTLLAVIMGFTAPQSGTVRLFGQEMNRRTVRGLRRRMTLVQQNMAMPDLPVDRLMAEIGGYEVNRDTADFCDRVWQRCLRYGLPAGALTQRAGALSGGERQRLALSMAMTLSREMLLLDEITAGLDAARRDRVVEDVLVYPGTVIAASHDDCWRDRGMKEVACLDGR